ncbi:MAG: hypothetical protein KGZ40_07070 [Clostridiales bacterium]|nr:hypothetical protein [Clostridiales bacterium]
MRIVLQSFVFASMVAVALSGSGCSRSEIVFVSESATYTFQEVEQLPSALDRPRHAGTPATEAPNLRRDALVELRGMGSEAADLAELVTRSLPSTTRAVPYYAEAADVEGVPSWIVVEIWGTGDGTLDYTRTWVLDRATGDVLFSSSGK